MCVCVFTNDERQNIEYAITICALNILEIKIHKKKISQREDVYEKPKKNICQNGKLIGLLV